MITLTLFLKPQSFEFPLPRLKRKVWLGLALGLFGLLAYGSLWQNIRIVSSIYRLQQLQSELSLLKEENKTLQASSMETASLENLEQLVARLKLEKVDQVRFISSLSHEVVSR